MNRVRWPIAACGVVGPIAHSFSAVAYLLQRIHRRFIAMCKSESLVAVESQCGRVIRNGSGDRVDQQEEREGENATTNERTMRLAYAVNL